MELNLITKANDMFPTHDVRYVDGELTLTKDYEGLRGSFLPVRFKRECAFAWVGAGFDTDVQVELGQEYEKKIVWIEDGSLIRVDRHLTKHLSESIIVEIMEDFINYHDTEVGKIGETKVSI